MSKSRLFLKPPPFHVQNSDSYVSLSLNYYCYTCQYIPSPNMSVLCLLTVLRQGTLFTSFVTPYIILPYARTKEFVSMLKTLHGTRPKQLLRATNCPYRAKHVTNAIRIVELMTPNSTNSCLLESYKVTKFIFVVFLKSRAG